MELFFVAIAIGLICGGVIIGITLYSYFEVKKWDRNKSWDRCTYKKNYRKPKEDNKTYEIKYIKHPSLRTNRTYEKEQGHIVTEKKSNDNEPKIGIKLSNSGNTRDEQLKKDSSRVYEIKEVKHINLQQSSLGENNSMSQDDCISNENGIGRVKKIHIGGFLK